MVTIIDPLTMWDQVDMNPFCIVQIRYFETFDYK